MKPTKTKDIIYLDHNATTPLDPEVAAAMRPLLEGGFGNPSSGYPLGQEAKEALEKARQEVADLLGCSAGEVVFTSGGSEADNLALKGLVDFLRPAEFHLVTSAVEHPAILNPACFLEGLGARVSRVAVDRHGWLDPQAVEQATTPRTRLISVMLANNETGTLLPLGEISEKARARGILVHTDAAQAIGKRGKDQGVRIRGAGGGHRAESGDLQPLVPCALTLAPAQQDDRREKERCGKERSLRFPPCC